MFHWSWRPKSQDSLHNHNLWRRRTAELDLNRAPSVYQPNALPLGQTDSPMWRIQRSSLILSSLARVASLALDHGHPALNLFFLKLLKCCFTSTETVGLLGTGAQDGHLDFHTAPELCCSSSVQRPTSPLKILTLLVHAGLFWCFHNPPDSDMDYRIFNVRVWYYLLHAHTKGQGLA